MNIDPNAWRSIRISDLRSWYLDQTDLASLRAVADEAGVGTSTLHNFLRGAMPHSRTRRKLAAWYLRSSTDAPPAVDGAISLLLTELPVEHHAGAVRGVLHAVESAFSGAGLEPPHWVGS